MYGNFVYQMQVKERKKNFETNWDENSYVEISAAWHMCYIEVGLETGENEDRITTVSLL